MNDSQINLYQNIYKIIIVYLKFMLPYSKYILLKGVNIGRKKKNLNF